MARKRGWMKEAMKTTTRRILPYELALNEALPWTVYDEFGNLLLREGYVVRQQRHLDSLFMRGAYIHVEVPEEDDESAAPAMAPAAPAQRQHTPHTSEPVFARTRRLANSLERLHADLLAGVMRNDMRMLVIGMAHVISQACQDDPDALLAGLHTNRSHSYLVVHQLLGAAIVELLAREAGVDQDTRSSWVCAALTRDVGMIDLQQQLDTQTQALTQEQQGEIRNHPIYAETILGQMGVKDPIWLQVVQEHQERCDGSGYPQRLLQDAICEGARLVGLADSYAAMVTPRANRMAQLPRQALQTLYAARETAYDGQWVQRLLKSLTPYPPGSMVKLANGEQALVPARYSRPQDMQVWAVVDSTGCVVQSPVMRHTADAACAIAHAIVLHKGMLAGMDVSTLWAPSTPAMPELVEA